MPLYLNDLDVTQEVAGLKSVLIVPCRMCPATSLSLRSNKPFFEFFKTLFRSPALDDYVKTLRAGLEERGINTGVYFSRQFLTCAWTAGERKKLLNRAKEYEAAIVLGCDSATESVRDALQSTDCKVIQGMAVAGIVNVKVRLRFPGSLLLQDYRIISVSHKNKE